MKKFCALTAILLLVTLFTTTVMAVPFTPSVEQKDSPVLVGTPDEDGRIIIGTIYNDDDSIHRHIYMDELIVTPILHLSDETKNVHEVIKQVLLDARDELKTKTWTELIADFAEKWQEATGGAPVENAAVSDIFDVRFVDSLTGELIEGRYAKFTIRVEYLTADDIFMLIHKPTGSNEWKFEEFTVQDGNVLTITVDSLSPFAVVKDTGAAPAVDPDAPDSPQTGVEEAAYVLPIACLVMVSVGAFLMILKKSKRTAA